MSSVLLGSSREARPARFFRATPTSAYAPSDLLIVSPRRKKQPQAVGPLRVGRGHVRLRAANICAALQHGRPASGPLNLRVNFRTSCSPRPASYASAVAAVGDGNFRRTALRRLAAPIISAPVAIATAHCRVTLH